MKNPTGLYLVLDGVLLVNFDRSNFMYTEEHGGLSYRRNRWETFEEPRLVPKELCKW